MFEKGINNCLQIMQKFAKTILNQLTKFMLLCQSFNIVGWIRTHRQKTHHWRPNITFVEHFLNIKNQSLGVLVPKCVGDVFPGLWQCSVRTPGPDKKQTTEDIKRIVIAIRDDFLFWSVLVKPLFPLLLVTCDLMRKTA